MGVTIKGIELEDIDAAAKEIISTIDYSEMDHSLAILALCRSIVMIAEEEELDEACMLIDKLDEVDREDSGN